MDELRADAKQAWINATDGNGVPTLTEYKEKVKTLKAIRTYIRTLDIPTISAEQNKFVDSLQTYLSAYNSYWESGKKNLSVNDYSIPLSDSEIDFFDAWEATCG